MCLYKFRIKNDPGIYWLPYKCEEGLFINNKPVYVRVEGSPFEAWGLTWEPKTRYSPSCTKGTCPGNGEKQSTKTPNDKSGDETL